MSAIVVRQIVHTDIRDIRDYYTVSHDRWNDAVSCFNHDNFFLSVYIAGYCAECILKYVILETLFKHQLTNDKLLNLTKICKDNRYRALKDHKIYQLIKLGNSENVFKGIKETDYKDLQQWYSDWRYAISHNIKKEQAKSFLESVVCLSESLKNEMSVNIKKMKEFNF